MTGIPVHTLSPINPHHTNAHDVTPTKTAEPICSNNIPVSIPANVTASVESATPSARPGAAAPAPTSTAQYNPIAPTRTIPPPSTTGTRSSPPPPQPGQAPSPKSSSKHTRQPSYPEPPQPISTPNQHPITSLPPIQTSTTNYPPPSPRLYTPLRAQPPAKTTSIAIPESSGLAQLPVDLSHPPGYRQDHRASFDDRAVEEPENRTHAPSPTRGRGRGLLDGEPVLAEQRGDESPIWDTARSWVQAAGKRLSQSEAQIWKALGGNE